MFSQGNKIKEICKKKGIKMSELAKKVGKSRQSVYVDLEKAVLDDITLSLYANAINESVNDLSVTGKYNISTSKDRSYKDEIIEELRATIEYMKEQIRRKDEQLNNALLALGKPLVSSL